MDGPSDANPGRLAQQRQQPPAQTPTGRPPRPRASERRQRHLRAVPQPHARLARHLGVLEIAFRGCQQQALAALQALDCELTESSESAEAAREQIAFIRVGMRCIADALDELHDSLAKVGADE